MPHRAQELVGICVVCRDVARDVCVRCAKPFCAEHVPGKDKRCPDCEQEFLKIAHAIEDSMMNDKPHLGEYLRAWITSLPILGIFIVFVGSVFPAALVPMLLVPPVVSFGSCFAVWWVQHQKKSLAIASARTSFLAEVSQRLLPEKV